MKKVIDEIGWGKLIKFAVYVPLFGIFGLLGYPTLRAVFVRLLGGGVGCRTIIHGVKFINIYRGRFSNFQAGDDVFIGSDCLFDLADKVTVNDQVTLAERVTVLTHTNVGYKDHPLQKHFPSFRKPVVFERGCFVGANVTVLPGVTVGKQAFVGAGSVVSHSVPAGTVVAGAPAKVVRKIKS